MTTRLASAIALWLAHTCTPAAAQRVALVMGNAAYSHVAPLTNPRNDARDMATALRAIGFQVTELLDADWRQMRAALTTFSQTSAGAQTALVYYSGHGAQYQGQNYLIPTDAQIPCPQNLPSAAIRVNEDVIDQNLATAARIFILDACRTPPTPGANCGGKDLRLTPGLAPPTSTGSVAIIYATAPGQIADDNPTERNGLFTKHLLNIIPTPGLGLDDLVNRTGAAIKADPTRAGKPLQLPYKNTPADIGGYQLVPAQAPPTPAGPAAYTEETGGLNLTMVHIHGGTYQMGCISKQQDCLDEAKTVHGVTVGDFYLTATEVTQAQWRALMGSNPSHYKNCDDCPVERVSWYDCIEFCNRLSELTGKRPCYRMKGIKRDTGNSITGATVERIADGNGYRLPTEAEWEYAARGGSGQQPYTYADSNAWHIGNSGGKTHPVKTKQPNALGLYGMSGNVLEWCWDRHGNYPAEPQTNPTGPVDGPFRVLRGGSWLSQPRRSSAASREFNVPQSLSNHYGFRLVCPRFPGL